MLLSVVDPKLPQDLKTIKLDVEAVKTLASHGVISNDEAVTIHSKLMTQAAEIHGSPVDEFILNDLTTSNSEKILRFFNLTRSLITIAGIIASIAIIALGGHYLLDILQEISAQVYEFLAFGLAGFLIYTGNWLRPEYQLFTILPGCLLLVGAFALFDHVHHVKRDNPDIYSFLCALIWGGVAVYYGNSVIGFFAVAALLISVGVSDLFDPFRSFLGYRDEIAPKVALAGFAVMGLDVIAQLAHWHTGQWSVFQGSAEWLGSATYFFSMLCIASLYYDSQDRYGPHFWIAQIIYIASIFATLYLGSMFELPHLLSITGWFTGFYLLEKYAELPWKGIGWAWAALGIAGALYFVVGFAQSHPQYFIFSF